MAYPGKFRDYTPIICPAGKAINITCTVADCLKVYPVDDEIETVLHEGGLKPVQQEYPRQRMANWRHRTVYQQCRDLMRRPVETRYQTLLKDLKESTADSYWNKEIGKGRDPIGGLPAGMDPATTKYGRKTPREVTMKDLLNPPVTMFEILCETNESHPMYKKSHNDYYPGEQVDRNYCQPPYDPNIRYGIKGRYDRLGKCMSSSIRGTLNPISTANEVQAEVIDRTHFRLGKCLTPNHSGDLVPPDFRFGKKSARPLHSIEELLRPDWTPNLLKKDYLAWITHLNELRNFLKKQSVDLFQLRNYCLYYDEDRDGWIPTEMLYKIFSANGITFNHTQMFSLATMLGYMENGEIRYKEFIDLLDIKIEIPDMGKFNDGDTRPYYRTSQNEALCDYLKIDNSNSPSAGTPTRRIDLPRPRKHPSGSVADLINLSHETTAAALINPSINTNFSISHLDFWEPRKPSYMRRLFENLGYKFPDDTFERLWKMGQEFDNSEEVCVDTFKAIIDQAAPFRKKLQPPLIYDKSLFKKKCAN